MKNDSYSNQKSWTAKNSDSVIYMIDLILN